MFKTLCIGLNFAKYAVFIFNILFLFIGFGMIAVGTLVHIRIDYGEILDTSLTSFPILLIVAGVILLILAYLSCCGAIKGNTGMIFFFPIILMAVVAYLEIGVGAGVYSKRDKVEELVDHGLEKTLSSANVTKEYFDTWHLLQTEFKCCGIDGPSNWKNHFGDQLPSSCCQKPVATCLVDDESVYQNGCKQSFLDFLLNNLYILAHVAFGAGLIQLLSIVFACCLHSAYGKAKRKSFEV